MTLEEKINIEHRLTEVEDRAKSNTKRINEHHLAIKENTELIGAIKELAVETKYMREDLNETMARLDSLENQDAGKWNKFKWIIVSGIITILLGYIAVKVGLTY